MTKNSAFEQGKTKATWYATQVIAVSREFWEDQAQAFEQRLELKDKYLGISTLGGVMRICEQCHIEKELDRFRKIANQYTAVHMRICKACYNNNRMEARRVEALEQEARQQKLQQQKALFEGSQSELAKGGVYSCGWVFALPVDDARRTDTSGKWLLWPEGQEAIDVWRIICRLTQSHVLGTQAKIACYGNAEKHVICVIRTTQAT